MAAGAGGCGRGTGVRPLAENVAVADGRTARARDGDVSAARRERGRRLRARVLARLQPHLPEDDSLIDLEI